MVSLHLDGNQGTGCACRCSRAIVTSCYVNGQSNGHCDTLYVSDWEPTSASDVRIGVGPRERVRGRWAFSVFGALGMGFNPRHEEFECENHQKRLEHPLYSRCFQWWNHRTEWGDFPVNDLWLREGNQVIVPTNYIMLISGGTTIQYMLMVYTNNLR